MAKKVIDTCRNIAKQEGIPLRQSYSRVTPQLLRQASNRKSPQQKIKARKATRRLQTIGRALVRELVRKMPQKQISPYAQTLLDAWSILLQNKTDKHKIYSLHEPHVSCISKGKAHKPFEFGSKVSISRTRDSGIILGALALPGNPYDGHTVQAALKQIKRIIGKQPEILIADRGCQSTPWLGSACPLIWARDFVTTPIVSWFSTAIWLPCKPPLSAYTLLPQRMIGQNDESPIRQCLKKL